MKKNGILCGFILSLIAGVIIGATGGILLFPKIFPPPTPTGQQGKGLEGGQKPIPADELGEKIMESLCKKLDMTEEQRDKVEVEVKAFAEDLEKFHNSNREELKSKYDAFIEKLAVLIPGEKIEKLRRISGEAGNPPAPPQDRTDKDRAERPPRQNDNPPGEEPGRRPPPEDGGQPDNRDRRPPPPRDSESPGESAQPPPRGR